MENSAEEKRAGEVPSSMLDTKDTKQKEETERAFPTQTQDKLTGKNGHN